MEGQLSDRVPPSSRPSSLSEKGNKRRFSTNLHRPPPLGMRRRPQMITLGFGREALSPSVFAGTLILAMVPCA